MLQRLLFGFFFLLLGQNLASQAQSGQPFGWQYQAAAKVVHGTDTLRNAWAGGFNSPQFSTIDLNGDSQLDLYVFDRMSQRSVTYLNVGAPTGGRAWKLAPEYAAVFPTDLQGWALLRDYDCDNRPDLFAWAPGGNIRLFRNVAGAGGRPSFQLVNDQLSFFNTTNNSGNIITGSANMPDIRDINGDGKLDIITFDWISSSTVELYLNNSAACGGLSFRQETPTWANLYGCTATCTEFLFGNVSCRPGQVNHTSGRNLLAIDLDGDGDQDVLTGRDYCTELISLTNQGTALQATMSASSVNTNFPAGTKPVRITNFPAAYSVDVTFDGRPDLVVAPNLYDNQDTVDSRQVVVFYENTSASNVPNFAFRQSDFLQRDMIEVSEGAAPALGDLDGDGLLDMLVGSTSRVNANGRYRSSLYHYRNVGSRTKPIFKLMSTDYLGLSSRRFAGLKPVLVDLNRDGALDLAFSTTVQNQNSIYYVLNTAAAGQPAVFNVGAAVAITGIPNRSYDAPCFTDVDGDGNVDLLLGTNINTADFPGYSLRYYRNTGSQPLSQAFSLVSNDFGQIRTTTGTRPVNLHPTVADFDADGKPDLLTADASGDLHLFPNYRAQAGLFTDRTDVLYNPITGQYQGARLGSGRLAPVAADLNGDNVPELLVGLETGGVVAMAARSTVLATSPAAVAALALSVYPNPATATATIEAAKPVRVALLDVMGRTVRVSPTVARQHTLALDGLSAGLYMVRCETSDGVLVTQRLVVQ
ncbi:T9SS type A sorting domain-containing protein [Hymenobacter sp. GOD-10R]|uniref:T9SS type A sorting domain-containing protein n=1 Tax=Hymenobacter sp. GOD-10R TaxID=3093922 RepID=UPI002D76B1F8|nr:T9SS type A sorting domain-containing protein [Hymenobacter sp. GOD-10R]WRQ29193.1 T9SS type A sorting domain-containing protein [Hymenobacter sp. GOD-10R]